jgi:23S rRNA (uracil1939-C5)-methyltransferase
MPERGRQPRAPARGGPRRVRGAPRPGAPHRRGPGAPARRDGPRPPARRPPPIAAGAELTVRFERMSATGEALARVEGRDVLVPYAAPGEAARVRVVRREGRRLWGALVAIEEKSPRVVVPRCPHFGRCGGCQWQHLEDALQREQKRALVERALAGLAPAAPPAPGPALGWQPWGFRSVLRAAAAPRDGRLVLGFFSWGGDRVVEVEECPVQAPQNVAALRAVRAAWAAWPALAPALAGLIARTGAATGEVLVGLPARRPLSAEERALVVRTLLDRVPGLVGLLEVRAPRRGHLLTARRAHLLWGRPHVREEVAGVRFQVPLLAQFPVNLPAVPDLVERVLAALDPSAGETILEPHAGIGGYTLHLALSAGRVAAVTTVDQVDAAWDNARLNGIANCHFYTRDPLKALEKVARRAPPALAFLHPPGTGLDPRLPAALRQAGVRRVVYLAGALSAIAADAGALARAGFRLREAQAVDLSPQTSRVHALLTADAG